MPRIEVAGATLHYEIEGSGSALVLIHGLGSDLHAWDPDVAVFASQHRVVRPDVRGFGESAKPPGPYSPALFAADLAAILADAQVTSAHILGISMGGVIAQRFALDFSSRVRSL